MFTFMPAHFSQSIPVSMPGVWFRVLYGELRTHSTFRDGDSLPSCMDSLWNYVGNGTWRIFYFRSNMPRMRRR